MTTPSVFKKTLLISLAGHLAVFHIFVFSFGSKIPSFDFGSISFFGMILRGADLLNRKTPAKKYATPSLLILDKQIFKERAGFISKDYIKPAVNFAFSEEKISFISKPLPRPPLLVKKKSPLMFYPILPHYFTLYFKDRQIVRIELLFNIISAGDKINSDVSIKRKISSGNLEVDLMTMRYIERYLFMQKTVFTPDTWQTVKIELSAKSD